MKYVEGNSIKINGKFICEFKNVLNDIIYINELDRSFVFFINGLNIINTNLRINENDLVDVNNWMKMPKKGWGVWTIHTSVFSYLTYYTYPCKDGRCDSVFYVDEPKNSRLDENNYWRVPYQGLNYFTVKGSG